MDNMKVGIKKEMAFTIWHWKGLQKVVDIHKML